MCTHTLETYITYAHTHMHSKVGVEHMSPLQLMKFTDTHTHTHDYACTHTHTHTHTHTEIVMLNM